MTQQYRYKANDPWRVVPFMVLGAVLQGGLAIGVSAADSLFISNIGADRLPVIYACMPLLMLAYITIYTRGLNRWGIDRLFVATIGVLVVGGFGFALVLRGESPPQAVYYVAMFYGSLWYIALYSLLWNFIDGFFDLSEAKRLFGLIAGGSAVGAIAGGFLVSKLSSIMGVAWLFGVWATTVLMALPIVWWIVRNVPRVVGDSAGEGEEETVSMRDTLRTVMGSRYVSILALVIFTVSLVATLCEFRYYTIFEEHYPDEAALAGLFGQLYAAVNVFNLVVTMFLFQVMVRWIGVRNVALIQPLIFLGVFAFLLLNGGFAAALFGFVAFQGVMTSIEYNNQNLLFNVLPEQGKESTRTFIEGICDPAATACAGIFLLVAQQVMSDTGISGVGFGASVVCLVLVLVLRVEFVRSMTSNVRKSWLDFSQVRRRASFVRETDLEFLRARADDGAATERERLAALERLWQLEPVETVMRLLQFIPAMNSATRNAAGELFHRILLTDNPKVIDSCLTWAEAHGAHCDAFVLEFFGRHRLVPVEMGRVRVRSRDPRDRAAGAIVLWESGRVADVQIALKTIDTLLGGNPPEIESGWHALSMIGEIRFIPRLLPNLRSPDPRLRIRALHALQPLMGPDTSGVQADLLRAMAYSRSLEERLLIVEAVERIGDSAIIEPLLRLTTDTVPHERRRLEHMLTSFGPRGVPAAVKVLQGTHYPLASRSIAAKALARVAFSQLEQMVPELIDDTVRRAYVVVAHRHVLTLNADRGPGTQALGLVYQDLPRLMLELALELLSVIGRLSSYDSVLAALRAKNGRDRGYALESIEQACGRRLFDRLLPILDERPDDEVMAMGLKLGVDPKIDVDDIFDRSLASAFAMEASAALQAKVESQPERVLEICRNSLVRQPSPMVRMTARSLIRRSDPRNHAESTVVEQVNELVQHVFFRNWGVRSLEAVADQLEECWHEVGEVVVDFGHKMDRFGVALEGQFRSAERDEVMSLPSPADFGRESLGDAWSSQTRSVVVTERARILWMPASALQSCLQAQPRLAIELLIWKLSQS
ncbi:MAG: Npt1/Npt2 family nucleotide transporter [bacterium]